MNAVSWRAQQSAVVCLLRCRLLPEDIPELQPLPAFPSLPSLKTCARWQSARCAHTQETCPVSRSKAGSHSPRGETRCQLGHRITLGATERIPDGGMCDISWLPSLSSRQSWRPQLCLRTLTGYVTRCPSDTFPGRESEYEMIVLFTSYLWHWLLAVRRAAQREIQSGCTAHLR